MKKAATLFLLFLFSILLLPNRGEAQQFSLSNQYVVNKFSISPAYAGAGDAFEVFGSYRRDWLGIAGAPETKSINVNGKLCKNMGLGGSVTSLQAGIFTNLSANLNYAYHVHLSATQWLSLGIGVGVVENHLDLSSKAAQDDPVVMNADRTSNIIDASFGILYHNKNLHIGFAAPRLISGEDKDQNLYYLSPQYKGHISYKLTFNTAWAIEPVGIVSLPKNAPAYYEIAVPIMYQQKVWLTPAYKKSSLAIGIGARIFGGFVFNYSYEFSSTGIASKSSGTHEITIGWKLSPKPKSDEPAKDKKKPYYNWLKK